MFFSKLISLKSRNCFSIHKIFFSLTFVFIVALTLLFTSCTSSSFYPHKKCSNVIDAKGVKTEEQLVSFFLENSPDADFEKVSELKKNRHTHLMLSLDKTKNIVNQDIKNYTEKWNKVINIYETLYKIKKDILIILGNSLRNLQKLLNQEFIMRQYEKDFQSIINSNDINERYIKISNISERMESKNKLELFNNIIYYSENYKNVLDENNFIDYLENITPGAFIPCSYIPSLKLIKEDIITERDKDSNIMILSLKAGGLR